MIAFTPHPVVANRATTQPNPIEFDGIKQIPIPNFTAFILHSKMVQRTGTTLGEILEKGIWGQSYFFVFTISE